MASDDQNLYERLQDRDRKLARRAGLLFALAVLILLPVAATFVRGNAQGFVWLGVGVAWGIFVAHWLVRGGGASKLWQGFRWLRWGRVQGTYHAFDDLEVRVEWTEEGPRVVAADVFKVLGLPFGATDIRRLGIVYGESGFVEDGEGVWWFTEAAVLDWLKRRSEGMDSRAIRFRQWLESDTFPPLRKKAETAFTRIGARPDR